jgi:hypothetical protein
MATSFSCLATSGYQIRGRCCTSLLNSPPVGVVGQLQAEHDLAIAEYERQEFEEKPDAMDRRRRHKVRNPGLMRHNAAIERYKRAGSFVSLLFEQYEAEILAKYDLAAAKQQATGIAYHVHHIVPLAGRCSDAGKRVVCGLHVPWNLRTATKRRNLEIGDRFDCDLPCCADRRCGYGRGHSGSDANGDIDAPSPF